MVVVVPLGAVGRHQIHFHSDVAVSQMGCFHTVRKEVQYTGTVQENTRKGNLNWICRLIHHTLMVALEDRCSTVEMGRNQEVDEKVVDEEGLAGKIAEGKVVPPGCSLTGVGAEEVAVAGIVAVEEVTGKVVDAVTGLEEEVDKEAGLLEVAGTDQVEGNKDLAGERTG